VDPIHKLFVLDIWWVPNDPLGQPRRHCMYDWAPIAKLFPRGLDWLANASGAAMMPYANYLCDNSSYATSGKWHTMRGQVRSLKWFRSATIDLCKYWR
jgi:hypothetical protein